MVDDRHLVYVDMYKAYRKVEEDYLNLLFNIERMPEEEELWMMKREKMLELNQLKEFMLNARQELDEAMRLWEMHLLDVQADLKQAQLKAFNPNFKGGMPKGQVRDSYCLTRPIKFTSNLKRPSLMRRSFCYCGYWLLPSVEEAHANRKLDSGGGDAFGNDGQVDRIQLAASL